MTLSTEQLYNELTTTSWALEVIADNSGKWVGNALRFSTEEEAREYGRDLAWRWTAVRQWRPAASDDPVNSRWLNGKLEQVA